MNSAMNERVNCCDVSWDEVADCRHCALRQHALFAPLRGSDFSQAFLPVRRAVVPAGTVLYSEQEPAEALFIVRWGMVKLSKQSPEKITRIVRLLGAGSAVGLEGLQEGVYWHTATAMQDTGLCRIPFQVIDGLQTRNRQLAERVVHQWEQYLAYADRGLTELSTGPVKTRVRHLVALLAELEARPSGEFALPNIHDLAAILGASVESVSRAMAELKRAGVLTRVAPHTYRCDLEAVAP